MAFLSQASHLGSLLLPHDAFQEHAAHRAEWSAQLSSKGSERTCIRSGLAKFLHCACTAHSDLVVKSQAADIIDLILQLIRHPNGVHRPWRHRKSRGAVLSTSEGQWATTKSFMKTCVFTPTHDTGILMADIIPYAGSHDTRLGRESSWPLAPVGTHIFSGR